MRVGHRQANWKRVAREGYSFFVLLNEIGKLVEM
ncbi:hypothetical protein JOC86_004755 [Bacillus pakistanensis]|uniref:Uncharacterized protein n=1 Tax=Rossellomorea pakistanensis TaxID=992288 RepID=A0ABS2NK14_9BACI|nr:hypothetical protein [Bacillus pakistanensis]